MFRTGQLGVATPSDLCKFRDELGIKTYLDLRSGQDYEGLDAPCYNDYPPSPARASTDPRQPGERRRVHCPFAKGLALRPLTPAEKSGEVSPEDKKAKCALWYQQVIRSEQYKDIRVQLGSSMVAMLILNDDEILKAMKVLVDRRNYPAAFGCVAGKDRTGLLACLVLSALNFSRDVILEDYMQTNEASHHINACTQMSLAQWYKDLELSNPTKYAMLMKHRPPEASIAQIGRGPSAQPLWEDTNVVSRPENLMQAMVFKDIMSELLDHVFVKEFESVHSYLSWIGFTESDQETLRDILLEPVASSTL